MREFSWPIRVYYEDTDAGGIVYHARYLHFYERARTEMLRQLQISQNTLLKERVGFVVKKMTIDYIAATYLDELLSTHTYVIAVKKASLVFKQTIINQNRSLVNQANVVVACINTITMKPIVCPEFIRMELS